MSSSILLCVLIKSAKIQFPKDECYSYVVIKIDNVKSTTTIVKGEQPNWEEEFYFDIPDHSVGFQIELWERGQFCDKLLGLCYISLNSNENLINAKKDFEGWIILDSEFILNDKGKVCQTFNPTEHSLLIRTYMEFPSHLSDEESKQLNEKLQILHEILDQKGKQLQYVSFDEINLLSKMYLDQQSSVDYHQLTNSPNSHLSDDSDYTSDVSYTINNSSLLSMSQSNIIKCQNENSSLSKLKKKPLAFVQPVIRDLSNSSRRINQKSFSYINQSTKFSMNKNRNLNLNEKNRKMIHSGN